MLVCLIIDLVDTPDLLLDQLLHYFLVLLLLLVLLAAHPFLEFLYVSWEVVRQTDEPMVLHNYVKDIILHGGCLWQKHLPKGCLLHAVLPLIVTQLLLAILGLRAAFRTGWLGHCCGGVLDYAGVDEWGRHGW